MSWFVELLLCRPISERLAPADRGPKPLAKEVKQLAARRKERTEKGMCRKIKNNMDLFFSQ